MKFSRRIAVLALSAIMLSACGTGTLAEKVCTGGQCILNLEPGEGAVLVVGSEESRDTIIETYFVGTPPEPPHHLDKLAFGFVTGWPALGGEKRLRDVFRVYRQSGATYVMAQGGASALGGRASTAQIFTDLAREAGLKAFIQPRHFYWIRGNCRPGEVWPACLEAKLRKYADEIRDTSDIAAWQLIEELAPNEEAKFAAYKNEWKRLFPDQLILQFDNAGPRDTINMKQRPYPDIVGYGAYTWWTRPNTGDARCATAPSVTAKRYLWTPNVSICNAFYRIFAYPKLAHTKLNAPSIFVAQGPAEYAPASPATVGCKTDDPAYRPPTAPSVGFEPRVPRHCFIWHRHHPPTNGWRAQNWLAITVGFKGVMFWSAGPVGNIDELDEVQRSYRAIRVGLVDGKLRTNRHLREVKKSWQEIRQLEPLLLNLVPNDSEVSLLDTAQINALRRQNVYLRGFRDVHAGHDILIVTNAHIGTWDGTSPDWLDWDRTRLTVDENGQLKGFEPATGKRTIKLDLLPSGVDGYRLKP